MSEIENVGFGEQSSHPLDSTKIFAGPNDGLSQTCNGISTFVGLEGRSQKAGYRVIFPTLDMGRYIEIAEEDILETEELAPEVSPFGALGGKRVSVRDAARIMTSRAVSRGHAVDDEFDLDIRLGASGWSVPPGMHEGATGEALYFPGQEEEGGKQAKPIVTNGNCPTEVCKTEVTCHTCKGENTCATCKGENTCATCKGENTCATCKGENTCATCKGENTCATCKGENTCATCKGETCVTCKGENTCVDCKPTIITCCKHETCF